MVDVVEASLDVSLDDPLVRKPWLLSKLVVFGTEQEPQVLERAVDRLAWSKAV
jgi:hypothetical protein